MLFWDVDTQVDFLSPEGRLYVPGSERIIPNLRKLTAWAKNSQITVIASADAHHPGDPELAVYGEHCMVGTAGQEKVPGTLLERRFVVPNRKVDLPDLKKFQQIILEKQVFDFSTNPNSAAVVQQFEPIGEIVLYGVVTEICVAAAARSLFTPQRKMFLIHDAIAELDAAKSTAFIKDFVARGGRLVTTEQVIASPESTVA